MPATQNRLEQDRESAEPLDASHVRSLVRPIAIVASYLTVFAFLEVVAKHLEGSPGISGLHPRAGLNLALLLGFGLRYAPALLLSSLISGLWLDPLPVPLWGLALLAAAITLGYALGASLLKRALRIDPQLRRLRDVLWFVLTASVTACFVGVLSARVLVLAGSVPWPGFLAAVINWSVSDAVGLTTLTPFLLVLGVPWADRLLRGSDKTDGAGEAHLGRGQWRSSHRARLEHLVQGLSILVVLWLVFGTQFSRLHHLFYLCFLPLVWIILRHGLPGAAAGILALNTGAILVVWAFDVQLRDVVESQVLMLVLAVTGLLLGSVVSARKRADRALQEAHDELEIRVTERTSDLTEANQRLQETQQALRASEERHALAIRGAHEGLWDWNLGTDELYLSPVGASIMGFRANETPARMAAVRERIHPNDRHRVNTEFIAHLRGHRSHFGTELRILQPDGPYRWISARSLALRDTAGKAYRMVGTLSDITDRKEEFYEEILRPLESMATGRDDSHNDRKAPPRGQSPEDELRVVGGYLRSLMSEIHEARTSLEHSETRAMNAEKLASVGRLAASVAHEIRNPLTSMRMRLFSIDSAARGDPSIEKNVQVVSEEIRRLEAIVTNFLEFSRPADLSFDVHDVTTLVGKSLELLRPQLEAKAITMIREEEPRLAPVRADSDQLRQVLINLLSNAVDAVEPGGQIRLTTSSELAPGGRKNVVIRTSDNGRGIPEEIRPRLFDPFFSTKEDGIGLGLCISAQIIERHGGRLALESSSENGSTFAVKIPAVTSTSRRGPPP